MKIESEYRKKHIDRLKKEIADHKEEIKKNPKTKELRENYIDAANRGLYSEYDMVLRYQSGNSQWTTNGILLKEIEELKERIKHLEEKQDASKNSGNTEGS